MIERLSRPFLVVAVLVCAATASAEENRGAPWQRAACAPDAFRLCSSLIPDAAKVESCLRQKQAELSNACNAIFARKAFAQRPAESSKNKRSQKFLTCSVEHKNTIL
jgi:hypothetical protein